MDYLEDYRMTVIPPRPKEKKAGYFWHDGRLEELDKLLPDIAESIKWVVARLEDE